MAYQTLAGRAEVRLAFHTGNGQQLGARWSGTELRRYDTDVLALGEIFRHWHRWNAG